VDHDLHAAAVRVFAQSTHAHHFLEFDLRPGVTAADAIGAFRRLRTPDVSAGGVNLVIAFGADAWREVAPWAAPGDIAWFTPIAGADGRRVPATQHDAWLWISGAEADVTWQSARAAAQELSSAAVLAAEQPAFTYRGGRDITGFVDGTANPPVRRAADVALVGPGLPGQAGSHVLAMRWSTTSRPSIACPSKTSNGCSVARKELEIFRRSVPFGTAEEHGPTDFSRPVSGAYYFAPSLDVLNELAGADAGR
jgi:deferrochelatase/peroxidase EfeB